MAHALNAALKMKRDYELIRKILLEVEANNGQCLVYSNLHETYQCAIMKDAGLLDGLIHENADAFVSRLTWDGHDFLDSIREETVWKKIKKEIGDKAGQVPFEILKDLAISASRAFLSQ